MFTIEQILSITDGKLIQGEPQLSVTSVHFDTRKLEKDGLFIALTSGARDGHTFLPAAQEKGAKAALISTTEVVKPEQVNSLTLILVPNTEEAFQQLATAYRQSLYLPFIAITGSNGKTTMKDMIAHVLASKKRVYKTKGNLNNHLGVPLSILDIEENNDAAVLELGMNHEGEIDFLARMVQPTISVITNIGDAHIEYFGTQENIAKAKGELLPHTDPSSYVLLNLDDPLVCSQADRYPGKKYYYSIQQPADIHASHIHYNEKGTNFRMHIKDDEMDVYLPMFGDYNVANALAAAFIAYQMGFTLLEIAHSLLSLVITNMRFEVITGPENSILINDAYNASPTSMLAAIQTFVKIYPQRKKVVVLGDIYELGKQSEAYHSEVGEEIDKEDLIVITIGKDSRHISERCGGTHFETKGDALEEIQKYLTQQYAILLKASRGMQFEDLVDQILHPETEPPQT